YAFIFAFSFYSISIFLFIKVLTTVGALTYDRYFYVASFGFCYLAALGIERLDLRKWGIKIVLIFSISIMCMWGVLSRQRVGVWKNSYELMSDMINMYPVHLPFAYNNRGLWLMEKGRLEEALL